MGGGLVFKTVHNYLVQFTGDNGLTPQLSEIEEARWFTPAGARPAISFKNLKDTLDAAISGFERLPEAP